MDFVSVQQHDFDLTQQVAALNSDNATDGAVVTFVGRVRNHNNAKPVAALELEHYPGMTEKSLHKIIAEAKAKWPIGRVRIIHRVGKLQVGEQIVFVGVTSAHRQAAYQANEFIMDFLKIRAPFWKKEHLTNGESCWLDARQQDIDKAETW